MFQFLRKIIFWLHLAAGIAAGLVILIIALTGIVISFERQVTLAANGFPIQAPADARKLPMEDLLAALKANDPKQAPTALVVESNATAPVAAQYGKEKTLYVDPYSGKILGEGAKGTRSFFQFVTTVHRWLAFQGKARDVGQGINSAGALVFFFMILSGLLLWIPKRLTRRGLRSAALFQGRLRGRAREWNWHNVLGIWFSLPLLVISATGLVIAYPWANALLFRLVGDTPPPANGPGPQGGGGGGGRQAGPAKWPESFAGLNSAWLAVQGVSGKWESIQFPISPATQLVFTIADSHRGRPDLRQPVTVDLATASITKVEDFASQSVGRKAKAWNRWIHTGEAGGWAGQLLAAFSACSAVLLVWTGFALSLRRFAGWRKKRKPVGDVRSIG